MCVFTLKSDFSERTKTKYQTNSYLILGRMSGGLPLRYSLSFFLSIILAGFHAMY